MMRCRNAIKNYGLFCKKELYLNLNYQTLSNEIINKVIQSWSAKMHISNSELMNSDNVIL